jgi:hypothetical protein
VSTSICFEQERFRAHFGGLVDLWVKDETARLALKA